MKPRLEFRSDITPGDYLLMNNLESIRIIAYSHVDKYDSFPFIVWVYNESAFGYGSGDYAVYEVQKHGRKVEYLREWPKTWTWSRWELENG